MAPTPTSPTILTVSSRAALQKALGICGRKPTLYIDLHGRNVSRNGTISVMTIYEPVNNIVCLIDIRFFGLEAFETKRGRHCSFKTILESPRITKVFFDVRNDADALYKHYGILLQQVCDIQLMELGTRTGRKKYVNRLEKCITSDLSLTVTQKTEWFQRREQVKASGNETFGHQHFEEHCAEQVVFLPELLKHYDGKLDPYWRLKVDLATEERLKMVKSPYYDPESADKVLGPWPHDVASEDHLNSDEYWDEIFDAIFPDDEDDDGLTELFNDLDCEDGDDLWGEDDDVYDQDTARDCIGWEEDMIRSGSPF